MIARISLLQFPNSLIFLLLIISMEFGNCIRLCSGPSFFLSYCSLLLWGWPGYFLLHMAVSIGSSVGPEFSFYFPCHLGPTDGSKRIMPWGFHQYSQYNLCLIRPSVSFFSSIFITAVLKMRLYGDMGSLCWRPMTDSFLGPPHKRRREDPPGPLFLSNRCII